MVSTRWFPTAATFVVTVTRLGCSPAGPETGGSAPVATSGDVATARDFCPELVDALDHLDSVILETVESDDAALLAEVAIAARKVAVILPSAEFEGAEIGSEEDQWFHRAHEAARVLFTVLEDPKDEYSDEELDEAMKNISGWLENSRRECAAGGAA